MIAIAAYSATLIHSFSFRVRFCLRNNFLSCSHPAPGFGYSVWLALLELVCCWWMMIFGTVPGLEFSNNLLHLSICSNHLVFLLSDLTCLAATVLVGCSRLIILQLSLAFVIELCYYFCPSFLEWLLGNSRRILMFISLLLALLIALPSLTTFS